MMKLIRWLLSHFFLILLIVIVIYGYMYWGNLAGRDTPAGEAIAYLSSEFEEFGEFVEAVRAKQAGTAQPADQQPDAPARATAGGSREADTQKPAMMVSTESQAVPPADSDGAQSHEAEPGPESSPVNRHENPAQAEAVPSQPPVAEQQAITVEVPPVSLSYKYNKTPVNQVTNMVAAGEPARKQSSAADTEAATTPAHAATTAAEERFVPEATVEQLNNVDRHGRIIDPAKQAEVVRKTWITARKSYYQRNYALSEESYRQVIDSTQDNYDAWGELGNVYFNQGKKKQAADAYFEAALILVDKGQVARARSLIGLLRHLDRDKAVELQKRIESAGSRVNTRPGKGS